MAKSRKLSLREASKLVSDAARENLFDAQEVSASAREKITLDIQRAMGDQKTARGDLIEKTGTSKQYISGILKKIDRGDFNFTIDKLAEIACALSRHLVIRILADDEASPIVPTNRLDAVRKAAYGLEETRSSAIGDLIALTAGEGPAWLLASDDVTSTAALADSEHDGGPDKICDDWKRIPSGLPENLDQTYVGSPANG